MDIKSKVKNYKAQLRKKEIQMFMAVVRKKMVQNFSLSQLSLQLTYNSTHSLQTLFEMFWDSFISPLQQNNNPKTVSIQHQIVFWSQHLLNLNNSSLQKSFVIQFILEFIEKNSWAQIKQLKQYSILLMEVMENALSDLQSHQRKQLAQWMMDLDVSPFLKRIIRISGQFLSPEDWSLLYKVIIQGLQSEIQMYQIAASQLIFQITNNANTSNNYTLYTQKPQIYKSLLNLLGKTALKEHAIFFWSPILDLLNAEEDSLLFYSRSGLIHICGLLIDSDIQSNIFGSLNILLVFSLSEHPGILDMLAVDEEMIHSKMWLKVALKKRLYRNEKWQVRKLFFNLTRNCFSKWEESQLSIDSLLGLLEGIKDSLSFFEDEDTLCSALQCLLVLLGWIRSTGRLRSYISWIHQKVAPLTTTKMRGNLREISLNVLELWEDIDRKMETV